jgi:RHS repeat-associated protein
MNRFSRGKPPRAPSFARWGVLTTLIVAASARAQTHVDVAARMGAAGGGGGVSSGTDGSVATSFAFELPNTTGRFKPGLRLAYNSNNRRLVYGKGWGLTEEYIDIRRDGTLTTGGNLQSRPFLVQAGNSQLLYAMSDGSYRVAVGDAYYSLQYSSVANTWTGTDGVGNQFLYSAVNNTSTANRYYLTSVQDLDGNQVTYRYEGVTTNTGAPTVENRLLEILYGGASSNLYSVLLEYNPGPVVALEARAGQLNSFDKTLWAVGIRRRGTDNAYHQTWGYTLQYTTSADTGSLLLSQISRFGHDYVTSLEQPFVFKYQTQPGGHAFASFGPARPLTAPSSSDTTLVTPTNQECLQWLRSPTLPAGTAVPCSVQDVAAWVDMDGDGRPDLVWGSLKTADGTNDGLRWARNLTKPHDASPTFDAIKLIAGSNGWTGVVSSNYPTGEAKPTRVAGATSDQVVTTRLLDVNGDRIPDLVTSGCLSDPFKLEVRFGSVASDGTLSFASKVCMDGTALKSDPIAGLWSSLPLSRTTQNGTYLDTTFDLIDLTGDGILDAVVLNGGGWYIYPGYRDASGNFAFAGGSNVLTTTLSGFSDGKTFPLRRSDNTGVTLIDLVDLNGDGIPDHVQAVPGTTAGIGYSLNVEYGEGISSSSGQFNFATNVSWWTSTTSDNHVAGISKDLTPYNGSYGTLISAILLDFNRDGRPDYLWADSSTIHAKTNLMNTLSAGDSMVVSGMSGLFGAVSVAYDSTGAACGTVTPCAYITGTNVGFVDVNGDGAVDYVVWDSAINYTTGWTWQSSQVDVLPSDVLIETVNGSGADVALSYAPNTEFAAAGTWTGGVVPVLVKAVLTGPGIAPLTTQSTYANSAWVSLCVTDTVCDALTRRAPSGFLDKYQQEDGTGQITHVQSQQSYWLAGLPKRTERSTGTFSAFAQGYSLPTISPSNLFLAVDSTWGQRPLASTAADCNATVTYPLIRYIAVNTRTVSEQSGTSTVTLQSREQVSCPDAFANSAQRAVLPDVAGSSGYTEARTYLGSPCVSCVVSEIISSTDATPVQLFYRRATFDSKARLITTLGPGDALIETMSYNLNGTASTVTKNYDQQSGASAGVVPAYAATRTYAYDAVSLAMTSEQVSDGTTTLITSYAFDGNLGLITSRSGPYIAGSSNTGPTTSFMYDAFNRLAAVAVNGNEQTAYTYALWNPPATLYASATVYAFASTVPATATPATNTDDVNASTTYTDALGRAIQTSVRLGTGYAGAPAAQISQSLGLRFLITDATDYDSVGRIVSKVDPYYSNTDPGAANPSQTWKTQLSTPGLHVSQVGYDNRSRPVCRTYGPVVGGSIGSAPTTRAACVTSDTPGNSYLRASWQTYGAEPAVSTDSRTYLFSDMVGDWNNDGSSGTAVRYYNDASGRAVYTKDQYQNVTQFTLDALGRRTAVLRFAGTPGASSAQVTDTLTYDGWGHVSKEVDNCNNANAPAPSASCRVRLFTYLPTGELQSAMQAPNASVPGGTQGVRHVYGSLGRATERDLVNVTNTGVGWATTLTADATFTYDSPGPSGLSNTAGRLSTAANAHATLQFGYDAVGRETARYEALQYRPAGEWEQVSRSFRNDGRLLRTDLNALGTRTLSYFNHYDSAGRSTRIDDSATSAGATEYWRIDTANGYDPLGRAGSSLLDNQSIQRLLHFDPNSNLATDYATQVVGASGVFVATSQMSYKGAKLTGYNDTAAGTLFGFGYDRSGRISQASASGNPSSYLSQNYSKWFSNIIGASRGSIFSAAQAASAPSLGNLTYIANASTLSSNTVISDKTLSYDPVNSEELRSAAYPNPQTIQDSISYDAGTGVVLSISRPNCAALVFQYDALDRLTAINPAAHEELLAYDGQGALVQRVLQSDSAGNPTSAQFYAGANINLSISNGIAAATLHVLANGVRIASQQSGSTLFYHRDHLGNVVATSVAQQGFHAQAGSFYRFELFGKTVASSETTNSASDIGFTGGLKLSEGLVFLGSRVYVPSLRQFLQPDNVDSNRYGYAGGDPVNRTDPSGHFYSNGSPTICVDGMCGVSFGAGAFGGGGAFLDSVLSYIPGQPTGYWDRWSGLAPGLDGGHLAWGISTANSHIEWGSAVASATDNPNWCVAAGSASDTGCASLTTPSDQPLPAAQEITYRFKPEDPGGGTGVAKSWQTTAFPVDFKIGLSIALLGGGAIALAGTEFLAAGAVGAAFGALSGLTTGLIQGKRGWELVSSIATGAAAGAVAVYAPMASAVGGMLIGAGVAGISSLVTQSMDGKVNVGTTLLDIGAGAAAGLIVGSLDPYMMGAAPEIAAFAWGPAAAAFSTASTVVSTRMGW